MSGCKDIEIEKAYIFFTLSDCNFRARTITFRWNDTNKQLGDPTANYDNYPGMPFMTYYIEKDADKGDLTFTTPIIIDEPGTIGGFITKLRNSKLSGDKKCFVGGVAIALKLKTKMTGFPVKWRGATIYDRSSWEHFIVTPEPNTDEISIFATSGLMNYSTTGTSLYQGDFESNRMDQTPINADIPRGAGYLKDGEFEFDYIAGLMDEYFINSCKNSNDDNTYKIETKFTNRGQYDGGDNYYTRYWCLHHGECTPERMDSCSDGSWERVLQGYHPMGGSGRFADFGSYINWYENDDSLHCGGFTDIKVLDNRWGIDYTTTLNHGCNTANNIKWLGGPPPTRASDGDLECTFIVNNIDELKERYDFGQGLSRNRGNPEEWNAFDENEKEVLDKLAEEVCKKQPSGDVVYDNNGSKCKDLLPEHTFTGSSDDSSSSVSSNCKTSDGDIIPYDSLTTSALKAECFPAGKPASTCSDSSTKSKDCYPDCYSGDAEISYSDLTTEALRGVCYPNGDPGANQGEPCTPDSKITNALTYVYDENGNCVVDECKSGYKKNKDGTKCKKEKDVLLYAIIGIALLFLILLPVMM